MDTMVLKTQTYLNAMYGHDARYNLVPEDGITGWATIYALTRALQIELGILSTADSFGPTTKSYFSAQYPNGVQQQADGDPQERNIYAIIQGALWCKGYSTGATGITKHFYNGTGSAVISLKEDAGLLSPNSTVTLNVMIALLSMNQYVNLIFQGGSAIIRSIQQRINRKYESYIGLAPCDGLYGRDMNKALIIVLQVVEGLSASAATGNFGATTKALLPLLPDTSNVLSTQKEADAIDVLKYALIVNGYLVSLSSSTWDSDLVETIKQFQTDMMLPITGEANTDTWMALLLSKGNTDRSATACDTRFEMTTSRISQLLNSGFQIVGRYLTGTEFKVLRADEPQRILDNGLKFFPIFQESGSDVTYFTSQRGVLDANKAVRAARKFRIPEGTVLYFAVDLDPLGPEIQNYVLPYFEALFANIDTAFKIGVYGTRNVCTKVCDAGYAVTSFLANMSTGFSGNMGFKMPQNWNFDQFIEISMPPDWGIDKVTYSGKFPPVTALSTEIYQKPAKFSNAGLTSIFTIIDLIYDIETQYKYYWDFKQFVNVPPLPLLALDSTMGITNFLRHEQYTGFEWGVTTFREIDQGFIDWLKLYALDLYNSIRPFILKDSNIPLKLVSDDNDGVLDIAHLAATLECYISSPFIPDFWTGWGGDLATAMASTTNYHSNHPTESIQEIANSIVGNELYPFKYSDMCIDADGIKLASLAQNSTKTTHALSSALISYYTNFVQDRYDYYVQDLNCLRNLTALKTAIHDKMNGVDERLPFVGLLALKGNSPTSEVNQACCNAFANYIYSELK